MTTTEYINVSNALQNLENEVSRKNFEAVRDLINHAAAEGIGESQQQRHVYAWKTVLNKFAGWKPGSDRAKVYFHLNNDDVNRAIRDEYGLSGSEDQDQAKECPFCGTKNESQHSECRQCGRPLSLEEEAEQEEEKQEVLERLSELEEKRVLDKLRMLDEPE